MLGGVVRLLPKRFRRHVSQIVDATRSETLTFTYDELDRLDTVSGPYSHNYDYNSIGNITSKNTTTYTAGQPGTPVITRYYFGGVRTDLPSPDYRITNTDFGYTSQRKLAEGMGGLMDYKARFYSPYLNQFTQPDTIVPDPYNPQSLNRYAYALNNPLRFTDPTGHDVDCGIGDSYCNDARQKYYRSNWSKMHPLHASFKSFMKVKDTYEYYQRHPDQAVEDTKGPNGTYEEKESITWAKIYSEDVLHKWFEPISYDQGIQEIDKFVASGKPATQWIMTVIFGTGIYAWMSQDEGGGGGGTSEVLQTGGHTLTPKTLKALGLTKDQGREALTALKRAHGIPHDYHLIIKSDGSVVDPKTLQPIDNIKYYVP